jgi:hypothetical protein
LLISVSYLPWIILDSWKSKTSTNCFIRFVLLDSRSQFLTSHVVFNYHAYTQRVDRIIPYKYSSFSILNIASRGTLPTPQALMPNTFNNCSKASLTKASWEWWTLFCNSYQVIPLALYFGTSTTSNFLIISPLHSHGIS